MQGSMKSACQFGCRNPGSLSEHKSNNTEKHTDALFLELRQLQDTKPKESEAEQLAQCHVDICTIELQIELGKKGLEPFMQQIKRVKDAPEKLKRLQKGEEKKFERIDDCVRPLDGKMEEKIKQCTSMDSKLSDALHHMGMKELRIGTLERSISLLELGSTDGMLLWKISNYKERMEADYEPVVYSPVLATSSFGYKLIIVAYLNGRGSSCGKNLSLFARLLATEFDATLKWPFDLEVSFTLMEQGGTGHITRKFKPNNSVTFQRPQKQLGEEFGFEEFLSMKDFTEKGFMKEDTVFVKVQVHRKPGDSNY